MRRSRPRFPPWRQTRPQYQQPYRYTVIISYT